MPVSKMGCRPRYEPYFVREKEKLDSSGAPARVVRVHVRTREMHYDTTTFAVRKMRGPRLGMSVTKTEHVPFLVPRTLVPTNMHDRAPRTMVRRSEPCDVFGIFKDT